MTIASDRDCLNVATLNKKTLAEWNFSRGWNFDKLFGKQSGVHGCTVLTSLGEFFSYTLLVERPRAQADRQTE